MPCRVSTIACSLQLGLLALAAASLLASPSSLSRDEAARCEGVVLTIEALARPDLEHALKIARPISTWSVRPDGTFLRPIPNVGCPAPRDRALRAESQRSFANPQCFAS